MYKKETTVYVVVHKNTLKVGVFIEKSQVCDYLGISKMTFYRNFVGGWWETDQFIVKYPEKVLLKTARGDKRGRNLGEYKK
jgi:hypothetical protein